MWNEMGEWEEGSRDGWPARRRVQLCMYLRGAMELRQIVCTLVPTLCTWNVDGGVAGKNKQRVREGGRVTLPWQPIAAATIDSTYKLPCTLFPSCVHPSADNLHAQETLPALWVAAWLGR